MLACLKHGKQSPPLTNLSCERHACGCTRVYHRCLPLQPLHTEFSSLTLHHHTALFHHQCLIPVGEHERLGAAVRGEALMPQAAVVAARCTYIDAKKSTIRRFSGWVPRRFPPNWKAEMFEHTFTAASVGCGVDTACKWGKEGRE